MGQLSIWVAAPQGAGRGASGLGFCWLLNESQAVMCHPPGSYGAQWGCSGGLPGGGEVGMGHVDGQELVMEKEQEGLLGLYLVLLLTRG